MSNLSPHSPCRATLLSPVFFCIFLLLTLLETACQPPAQEENPDSIRQTLQSLAYLNQYVGKTPDAVGLWQTEPLRSQLMNLVGSSVLPSVLQKFRTAKTLKRDHVLYTIAVLPDSARQGYAVALFDTVKSGVNIVFIQRDTVLEIKAEAVKFYWPDEVRNLLFNYQGWEVYEGVLPHTDGGRVKTNLALDTLGTEHQFFLQRTYLQVKEEMTLEGTVKQFRGVCEIRRQPDTVYTVNNEDMGRSMQFLKKNRLELEWIGEDISGAAMHQDRLLSRIN